MIDPGMIEHKSSCHLQHGMGGQCTCGASSRAAAADSLVRNSYDDGYRDAQRGNPHYFNDPPESKFQRSIPRTTLSVETVTRITVIGPEGVEFERYDLWLNGVELQLQDDGRTLKVFPREGS